MDLSGSGYKEAAGCCEKGNEHKVSLKSEELFFFTKEILPRLEKDCTAVSELLDGDCQFCLSRVFH